MVLILLIYFGLLWLVFFKLKLLPWNRLSKICSALLGLGICLYVIAQLNTTTPSGRIAVMGVVVEIAPSVRGEVTEVTVTPNQSVAAGDVLFRIDPAPYQATVDEARASVEIASLTLQRQQSAFDKNPGLSVSQQDLDESRAALDAAQARLQSAQLDLENTIIRAPQNGIVTAVSLSPGNQVRSSAGVMPFIETGSLRLVGVFSQNGSAALTAGMPAELVLDAAPGRILTSSVSQISPGTSGGQIPVSSDLLSAASIGSSSEVLIILDWPEDLPPHAAQLGMVGSATVYSPEAGPFEILAKILIRIRGLAAYL
jgi:multidrug resistance efflux pump